MVGKWFGFECKEVFEEARALFERKDFEEATKAFEACKSEHESDPLIERYLGKCYEILATEALKSEEFSAAAANAESALLINPGYPDLHLIAARAYLQLERVALCRRHIRQALAIHPEYSEAKDLMIQADAHFPGSEMPGAELGQRESHSEYLREVGDKCLDKGLLHEAMAVFEKADELTPNYADIKCRIGTVHLLSGNDIEAEKSFNECLRINGTYVEALMKLAHIHRSRGLTAESDRISQRALAIDAQANQSQAANSVYIS